MKKTPNDWTGLKPHELVLLGGIFSNGARTDVELSSLQNQFYKKLPGIKDSIFDALMERGYFQHRPDYVRSGYVGGGIVAGVSAVCHGQRAFANNGNGAGALLDCRDFFRRDHRRVRLVHAGAHRRRARKHSPACWASRIF